MMNTTHDPARRRVLGALATSPLLGSVLSSGCNAHATEWNKPVWAPPAGHIVAISHPAGRHPDGRGATLAEISPQYEDWNPTKPSIALYGNGYSFGSWYGYCGAAFNADTRQLIHYGTGHASINVCAPLCFDLNDRRWKWLDRPLPFDALGKVRRAGFSYPSRAQVEAHYPPEQYNFEWGDVNGDWAGWPSGYGRPGKIQPLPTHTYGTTACIPAWAMGNAKGGFLMFGSYEGVINSSGCNGSHVFDFDTQTWHRGANHWPGEAAHARGCRVDPATGKAIVFGAGSGKSLAFHLFDPATKLWTTRMASGTGATTNTDHPGNVIHEAARLYIVPGQIQANGQPATWRYAGVKYRFQAASIDAILGTGSFSISVLTVNEQGGWPLNDLGTNTFIGWAYCPEDSCLYAINGVNGSNKYWRLAPPVNAVSQADFLSGMWALTEHTFARGVVQSPGPPRSMMFNRLNWDRVSRSFVFWPDSVNGPVQAFRPAPLSPAGA